MALSGSFNTSAYDGKYLKLSWTATQSIANNTSTISWKLTGVRSDGGSGYVKAGGFKVVIAGETVYSKSTDYRIELHNGTVVASGTKTIAHNSDGTKSFTASAQGAIYTYAVNCTGSDSFTLNQIPRQATITAAPNITNNTSTAKITYSNPAGNAVSGLQARIASSDGKTTYAAYRNITKTGTNYTFTLTNAEKTALLKACANSGSITIRFYVKTTISGNTYLSSLAKTYTVVDANPTLAPTAVDSNETTIALTGNSNTLVKYYSNLTFAANATPQQQATIKSYKITCGKNTSTSASGTFNKVESNIITFEVTDSRGFITETALEKGFVDYVKLTCNMAVGAPTTDGKLTITANGKYFNGSFGSQSNSLFVYYRYKVNNGAYGGWISMSSTLSNNTYTATASLTGLDYQNSYTFQTKAVDKLATVETPEKKVKTTPIFDWGENDFNFNVPVVAPSLNGHRIFENKILWSGAKLMKNTETITLSEPITSQPNGVVLVFSGYNNSTHEAYDYSWSTHFVPKIMISFNGVNGGSSGGQLFLMARNAGFSTFAGKYLFISDTSITGNNSNSSTGTGTCGIKYSNANYVLRYVIGV